MYLEPIIVILCVALACACVIAAFAFGARANSRRTRAALGTAREQAQRVLDEARREADTVLKEARLEAKEEFHTRRDEVERETNDTRLKLHAREAQLHEREANVERKLEVLSKKEHELQSRESGIDAQRALLQQKQNEAQKVIEEQNLRLERIAGMSRDDAKTFLVENLTTEAKNDAARIVKDIRDRARADAKHEAQRIIVQAIQRSASDYSVETTVSVVHLLNEEMKGRIIGREGRNIRAFESVTGIDVIVDDTPDAVIISGFDPFRREVARIALERLMSDGRVHPARIEEVVEKVRKELEEEIVKEGENALLELGLINVHPELVRLVGKMKYRSSYGQNLLMHSMEVAYLCGVMAVELGLDPVLAKRAGVLHDVGKVVDRNTEGPHALLGYDLAKRFQENAVVVNAIGSHHEDIEMESPYAVLVQSADAISGARPGARRESLEGYIKRLEKLEALARSFEGVAKTFAIQAGREVRVIVEPDKVDDLAADRLSSEIAAKIQHDMEYPGQIKVTVIREKRATAVAK